MPNLSEQFRNHVNSKKQYVLAYSNGGTSNTKRRNEFFKIKSYLSGDSEKDKMLYLKYNYFRLVSHKYADYEIGKGLEVVFKSKDTTNRIIDWIDSNNIQQSLYKSTIQKSKVGYSVVRVRYEIEEKKIFLERIPVTNYFANVSSMSLGSSVDDIPEHSIVSITKELQANGEYEWFSYVDNYKKDGNKRIGTYGKYEYDPKFNFTQDKLVEDPIIETLDYLPIFIFNNDILDDDILDAEDIKSNSGTGLVNGFFGESDYVDIMDIGQDINDRQSQISVEFIKHLSSKISLPQSFFDGINNQNLKTITKARSEDKESRSDIINREIDNFDYVSHGPGEATAQYITKDSGMIDKAHTQIENNIRSISTFTSIPVFMLGLESASGNRHVGTDLKDMESFIMRVEQKRNSSYSNYQKMFAYISYLLVNTYELPTIKFPKLPNGDLEEKVRIAETMKNNGFLSQKSIIKYVNNFDEEEYSEEKKQIDQELVDETAIKGNSLLDSIED